MDQKRKEQRIPIPEDVCTYLQMLKYEADGLRVLCVQAAESGLPEEMEISGKNLPESLKEDAAKEYGLETEAITLVP